MQGGILGWLRYEPDPLSFYLLWSTAAAFIVLGAMLHRALYTKGFSKSQEGGGLQTQVHATHRATTLSRLFGITRGEFLIKELRLFFRDTTQWSQLILLVVLIVVYVFNIQFLPLKGPNVTFFLINVIPFLNLVLAGFVLASIAARFLFPSASVWKGGRGGCYARVRSRCVTCSGRSSGLGLCHW